MLSRSVLFDIVHASANSVIVYARDTNIRRANRYVTALHQQLNESGHDWFLNSVPSYNSVLVSYDWVKIDSHGVVRAINNIDLMMTDDSPSSVHNIAVWYGAKGASDLAAVCAHTGLSENQVIEAHCQLDYRVYAVGFMPGFAYLGELPSSLSMPRMAKPRLKVPKGAVAIADRQTAVYPNESPGGWHLLGLSPDLMLDQQSRLSRLAVGDLVHFEPIDEKRYFQELAKHDK